MAGQDGDVRLYQTTDGGNITVAGGLVEMSGGLETAAYLSLFGGNEEDDGRSSNQAQWWGNYSETAPENRYRSEAGHLLRALPAIPANLRRIEDAASRDLAWMVTVEAASEVSVSASIPALNTIQIDVEILADFGPIQFKFIENWTAEL